MPCKGTGGEWLFASAFGPAHLVCDVANVRVLFWRKLARSHPVVLRHCTHANHRCKGYLIMHPTRVSNRLQLRIVSLSSFIIHALSDHARSTLDQLIMQARQCVYAAGISTSLVCCQFGTNYFAVCVGVLLSRGFLWRNMAYSCSCLAYLGRASLIKMKAARLRDIISCKGAICFITLCLVARKAHTFLSARPTQLTVNGQPGITKRCLHVAPC